MNDEFMIRKSMFKKVIYGIAFFHFVLELYLLNVLFGDK